VIFLKNKQWIQVAILTALLVIAVVTVVNGMSNKTGKFPKVGDKAPDFQLAEITGRVHSLTDYKGKTVIVNFWGTFCPPCREEMPALQKQSAEWAGKGVVVLGVNLQMDSDVAVKSFLSELNVTFTIVRDTSDEVRKTYGVTNFPTTFFVDANGKIRAIHSGQMDEAFIRNTLAEIAARE
jgi:peroxiredoxin